MRENYKIMNYIIVFTVQYLLVMFKATCFIYSTPNVYMFLLIRGNIMRYIAKYWIKLMC